MAQPQAKRKDNDRQNCTRASCLFGFGFYAQAPTKSPVMPRLDADEVQATRKLIPTARELVSPQRHRCVIAQKVIHPFVTDCTFQLRPPTQSTRLIRSDGVRCWARAASSQTSWRSSMWMLAPLDVRTGVLPPGPTGSLTTVTVLKGRPCDLQYSARLFASSSVCRPRATPEKETIWNSILP